VTWKKLSLRAAAEVTLGRQRSPENADGPHMRPYLRAANVKDGALDISSVLSMNFTLKEQAVFALAPGDVLVTEGSGSVGSVGATSVWRGEIDDVVCFQNTLLRLRPRDGTDPRFLGWWARAAHGSGLFASIASGANIYHISAERVRALPIGLPPIEEQRRISDFLEAETSQISRLVELRMMQSSLLGERWQAQLSSIAARLNEKYGTRPLRYVLLSIEQGWSPQCDDRKVEADEWGVVKAGCVNGGIFRPDQHKALPIGVAPKKHYRLRAGDLLMSRASGSLDLIGSVAVVPQVDRKLLLCDKVYRLNVSSRLVCAEFVAHMLRTREVRDYIRLGVSGAEGMANNLPTSVVRACKIPAAPLKEQKCAVNALDTGISAVEVAQAALSRQLELLAERRRAVVAAAVTGELDVTTARRVSSM
jgi:type I restriction enzyme S subunit